LKIILDQGAPAPLRKHLSGHSVSTAFELGWASLKNGELIQQAEAGGYDLLLTTDQNLKYQQNLAGRKISILVLSTTSWPRIEKCVASIVDALNSIGPGSYKDLVIP
jgi:hypothetical protein